MTNARTLSTYPTVVTSGTYTPSLTNTTNITSSTPYTCQYMRVGSVVNVSGAIFLTFTSVSTATEVGISLPIASNLAQTYQLGGGAGSGNGIYFGTLQGDVTNDRATLKMTSPPTGTTTSTLYFNFTYQVI